MSGADRTLLAMVQEAAARSDEKRLKFVHAGLDGALVEDCRSHADLLAAGSRIAGALRSKGLRRGDRIALVMRNHPEFVETMVASEMAGTVFVPIDPRMKGSKLAYMLRFSGARVAIISSDVLPEVKALLPQLPELQWIWLIDGDESDGRHLKHLSLIHI